MATRQQPGLRRSQPARLPYWGSSPGSSARARAERDQGSSGLAVAGVAAQHTQERSQLGQVPKRVLRAVICQVAGKVDVEHGLELAPAGAAIHGRP